MSVAARRSGAPTAGSIVADRRDPDRFSPAKALLVKQLVAFVRDVRQEQISDESRRTAGELVHLAHSLFPETRP